MSDYSVNSNQKGIATIAIIIGIVVIAILGISTAFLVNNLTSDDPATQADPSLASNKDVNLPTPKITLKPLPTTSQEQAGSDTTPTLKSETGTTSTGWKYTGVREVTVIPSFSSDGKTLYIDFQRTTFNNIASITYELTYYTGSNSTKRVDGGTFDPSGDPDGSIRKQIVLGTCSKGVCTYYDNTHDYSLLVKSKRIGSNILSTQTLTKD